MEETCYVEPVQKISSLDERKNLATVGLTVWGIGCINCATRIRNALLALAGVMEADVDHTTGSAFVEYNPGLVSVPSMFQAVANAGDNDRHKYTAMLFEDAAL
jgi:copper chaperone CopZ